MKKIILLTFVGLAYIGYTFWVYTIGTTSSELNHEAIAGKKIWQAYNCQSCHQIFGLGGFLGPDLTTAISDSKRGETYIRAILKSGGNRMPVFGFTDSEINQLVSYLRYINKNATVPQTP